MRFRLWLEENSDYLYHGTSDEVLPSMYEQSMADPSWWGTERVAWYYAEEMVDEIGGNDTVLRVPIARFDTSKLEPDHNSIAEPLTHTLGQSEDKLYERWEKSVGTWQDCLSIYESVIYRAPMAITPEDRYE